MKNFWQGWSSCALIWGAGLATSHLAWGLGVAACHGLILIFWQFFAEESA